MALLKRSLAALHEQANTRSPSYVDEVLARAERVDDEHYWIDPQAYLDLCRRWQTAPPSKPRPSKVRQLANIARSTARATRSVTKTTLGMDRASDEQVEARLDVCRRCPGGHAVMKDGDVHTCGPMLESMQGTSQGTCGCILRKKARDLTEHCPFGWWPK